MSGFTVAPFSPEPLPEHEIAKYGFTHRIRVKVADLVAATAAVAAATAYAINLALYLKANDEVQRASAVLVTPFAQGNDAGNNTTTIEVGDTGSATRFIASTEMNLNGAYVVAIPAAANTALPYREQADTALVITIGAPAAGKYLNLLTAGEVHVFLMISKIKGLTH